MTLFSICMIESWRAYQHHLPYNHYHKNCEVQQFVSILAKDCFENKYSTTTTANESLCLMDDNKHKKQIAHIITTTKKHVVDLTSMDEPKIKPTKHKLKEAEDSK